MAAPARDGTSAGPDLGGRAPRVALAVVVLLAMWPLRGAAAHPLTTLLGTAIDTVHHAWGLWYVAEGDATDTFWPVGAFGTVIGGPSVVVGAALTKLVGAIGAYTATCALQVALALVGTGLLAERLGGGARRAPWAAPAAAVLLLCGRPLLAQIGWGVPEGAAVGWLALALAVGLAPEPVAGVDATAAPEGNAAPGALSRGALPRGALSRGALPRGALTGALLGASLVENPYTLPLVALAAVGLAIVRLRTRSVRRLAGEMIGGAGVLGAWVVLAHGEGGSLAAAAVGHTYAVLGRAYVAEGWDGRAHLAGLLQPWLPLRYDGARLSDLLAPGAADSLGWAPVALAGVAAVRIRAARYALAAAVGLGILALGSFPAGDASGIPGPFLYVNLVIGLLVRPLTQPVRYLVPAGIALAVAGGLLVGRWAAEGRHARVAAVFAIGTAEALAFGSLATPLPTFDLGAWTCLANLDAGPVATQVAAHPFETSGAAALAMQMVHGQPGTHRAIGGWAPRERRSTSLEAALGTLADADPARPAALRVLADEGVRWLITDVAAAPAERVRRTCGGIAVVDLHATTIAGSREGQELPVPR